MADELNLGSIVSALDRLTRAVETLQGLTAREDPAATNDSTTSVREKIRATFWQPKVFTVEAISVLVLVGVRALSVSHYRPEVAVEVLERGGLPSVALGSVVPLIPSVLPYAILGMVAYGVLTVSLRAWVVGALLVMPTLLVTPGPDNVHSLHALIAAGSRDSQGRWVQWVGWGLIVLVVLLALGTKTSAVGAAVGALAIFFTMQVLLVPFGYHLVSPRQLWHNGPPYEALTRMWLPPERVQLADKTTLVGYALQDTPRESVFLVESTRLTRHIKAADVVSRTVCRVGTSEARRPVWSGPASAASPVAPC